MRLPTSGTRSLGRSTCRAKLAKRGLCDCGSRSGWCRGCGDALAPAGSSSEHPSRLGSQVSDLSSFSTSLTILKIPVFSFSDPAPGALLAGRGGDPGKQRMPGGKGRPGNREPEVPCFWGRRASWLRQHTLVLSAGTGGWPAWCAPGTRGLYTATGQLRQRVVAGP